MSGKNRGGSLSGHYLALALMVVLTILRVVSIGPSVLDGVENTGRNALRFVRGKLENLASRSTEGPTPQQQQDFSQSRDWTGGNFQPSPNDRDGSVNDAVGCAPTTPPSPPSAPRATTPFTATLSSGELNRLRYHALRLINNDRAIHGLPPVVLGTNMAAQLHAEDMLINDYFGHWWADGRKPYMVYTQTGGTSYVAENVATSGWTDREWAANGCNMYHVRCAVPTPREEITNHQWGMMYDDAHANWGHRDNILGKTHRAVNIGIGFNGRRMTFVQHFEGGAVQASGPPVLDQNGQLCLSLDKRETGIAIGAVSIAYDPLPTPKTPTQINSLGSYCTGGGFTVHCPEFSAAGILKPLRPGYHYSNLSGNKVVASKWIDSPNQFTMTAKMGSLLQKPGVYTVIAWRDDGGARLSEQLVALSLFVE